MLFLYCIPEYKFPFSANDTVGWATGKASGTCKKLGVGLLVVMI